MASVCIQGTSLFLEPQTTYSLQQNVRHCFGVLLLKIQCRKTWELSSSPRPHLRHTVKSATHLYFKLTRVGM
ncbi:Orotidine 5'-phosphate decarboxylase [Gossypium arboreum]|uniref:Orotidine 5'-phosphate decarboxylase n=1 Tax=Gossypium arboreum TaxID=29729 RepID=A0A0B0NJ80_GOSAR|nr:Orotidine 5'-phosphate decarboxylase [Gossypium arboreum]